MRGLITFVLDVLIVAASLWVVARFVPGVDVVPSAGSSETTTFLAIAAVFVVINAVIGPVLRFIGLPLSCVTFGLFTLVINAAVFALAGSISNGLGLGLEIEGFWPALLGAALLGLVRSLLGVATGALTRR